MTPWMYIVAGGLFETVWATTMKLSEGFTEPVWTVSTFVFLILSVVMLNKGLGELPMGSAYTVWVGMGAVGSIFVGIIFSVIPSVW